MAKNSSNIYFSSHSLPLFSTKILTDTLDSFNIFFCECITIISSNASSPGPGLTFALLSMACSRNWWDKVTANGVLSPVYLGSLGSFKDGNMKEMKNWIILSVETMGTDSCMENGYGLGDYLRTWVQLVESCLCADESYLVKLHFWDSINSVIYTFSTASPPYILD